MHYFLSKINGLLILGIYLKKEKAADIGNIKLLSELFLAACTIKG